MDRVSARDVRDLREVTSMESMFVGASLGKIDLSHGTSVESLTWNVCSLERISPLPCKAWYPISALSTDLQPSETQA